MPMFFFHLHESGATIADEEGVEIADAAAARLIAIRGARDVMAGEIREGRLSLDWFIVIEGADRTEIERVSFRDALKVSL